MKRAINSIIALLSLLCLIGAVKLSSLPLWSSFSENSFWYTSPTVRVFAEHPTLTDIHNLTSAVDEYIRDKYELELLL